MDRYQMPWPAHSDVGPELAAVKRALYGNCLTVGTEVEEVEREISAWLNRPALAVSSGTAALELAALLLADVVARRVVVVPAFTFISTVSPFVRVGAELRFADCLDDGTVDPDSVEAFVDHGDFVAAIVATDVDGTPFSRRIVEFAAKKRIPLVEDACPAWGSTDAGHLGFISTFSVSDSKILAAGEGGFVTTDDEKTLDALRALRRYGELPTRPDSDLRRVADYVGGNYKMPELTAAIVRARLPYLGDAIALAKTNAALLDEALSTTELLRPRALRLVAGSAMPHKYRMRIDESLDRGDVEDALERETSIRFLRTEVLPLFLHPAFDRWYEYRSRRDGHSVPPKRVHAPNAERILKRTIPLGDRGYPLWHTPERTVERWADELVDLDEKLKGLKT